MASRRCNTLRHQQLYAWRKKYRAAFKSWPSGFTAYNQMEFDAPDGAEIDLYLNVFIGRQRRAELRLHPCPTCLGNFLTSLGITRDFLKEKNLPELISPWMPEFEATSRLDKQILTKERLLRVARFAAQEVLLELGILKNPENPPQP